MTTGLWDAFWDAWTSMVGAMNAIPPPAPAAPVPAPVHRFALAVTPESLQQRWHAVLRPEAASGEALEFSTPLDLLRHLARLAASPPDADPFPTPRTGPAGLR